MPDPAPSTEIELKLRVRPEDLPRLRAAPAIKAAAAGRAVTRVLESTYYDTADLRLRRRLVSLRVRKQGDAFIQTLKTGVKADGLTRDEWEWPLTGPAPDLGVIHEDAALEQLDSVRPDELRPLFTSHVERTLRRINGAADIEVAFDRGEIRTADGRSQPLAEVELELKRGSPQALYELALALAGVAPVWPETRTKAARGYALAAGEPEGAVKAGRLALDPESATVEDALAAIMRNCLNHLRANEACAVAGDDPEGIHQMRVALRRLRSALALFRPLLPADQYDPLVAEVKWLAGTLGPARDWDVFLEELLAPVQAAFADSPGLSADLAALEAAARACRAQGYAQAREAIGARRAGLLLLRLGAWLEARGWRDGAQPGTGSGADLSGTETACMANDDDPWSGLAVERASRLLARRHKKARKAGRDFADLSPEQRHQVRIALKKLRYAAEFFRSLYDEKPARRYIQELSALQDALGHLNDVATATRLMATLRTGGAAAAAAESTGAGLVVGWHARGAVELEARLQQNWEHFLEAKPFWS